MFGSVFSDVTHAHNLKNASREENLRHSVFPQAHTFAGEMVSWLPDRPMASANRYALTWHNCNLGRRQPAKQLWLGLTAKTGFGGGRQNVVESLVLIGDWA